MASLKEIKKRINSIKSTRKTTSAMKMVASSKLHKAERTLSNLTPYSKTLSHYIETLLSNDTARRMVHEEKTAINTQKTVNLLMLERPVNNVAIIVFSSDSSLCGAFNVNVLRKLFKTIDNYKKKLNNNPIFIYTIGKKVFESIRKTTIPITKNYENLAGKDDYDTIARLAKTLITQFESNQIDRVELIFHQYKSAGSQELVCKQLLPFIPPTPFIPKTPPIDHILEPSSEIILQSLFPTMITVNLYHALLHSNTSEHAARMIAMQTATDNADDLIDELTIEYNKSRQQAITNELLDLIGGSAK